jgi:hypothetical protein
MEESNSIGVMHRSMDLAPSLRDHDVTKALLSSQQMLRFSALRSFSLPMQQEQFQMNFNTNASRLEIAIPNDQEETWSILVPPAESRHNNMHDSSSSATNHGTESWLVQFSKTYAVDLTTDALDNLAEIVTNWTKKFI